MKRNQQGLTIIEMLTVLAVIAILIGLLLPAYEKVRHAALDAKQKAQFTTIGLGLEAFRQDFGQYPPSNSNTGGLVGDPSYTGAQKLAEAMVGRHLLGYNPNSPLATTDGMDAGVTPYPYPAPPSPGSAPSPEFQLFRSEAKDYYVDIDTANAFRVGNISVDEPGLFNALGNLAPNTHVLCDVYEKQTVRMPGNTVAKAGAPILYYRADTTKRRLRDPVSPLVETTFEFNTYNALDNDYLVRQRAADILQRTGSSGKSRPFAGNWELFYGNGVNLDRYQIGYIQDATVTSYPTPYRPDSFILISAGKDGIYGTGDDVTNFGN